MNTWNQEFFNLLEYLKSSLSKSPLKQFKMMYLYNIDYRFWNAMLLFAQTRRQQTPSLDAASTPTPTPYL